MTVQTYFPRPQVTTCDEAIVRAFIAGIEAYSLIDSTRPNLNEFQKVRVTYGTFLVHVSSLCSNPSPYIRMVKSAYCLGIVFPSLIKQSRFQDETFFKTFLLSGIAFAQLGAAIHELKQGDIRKS